MANMFSLGPRVLISQEALQATELIKTGSRVRERYLLKIPAGRRSAIVVRTSREARHGIGAGVLVSRCPAATQTFLDQLARYLGRSG
ncbi:MAG: hypothetical protein U0361_11795 [Nitrospiraceae bacterium]